MKQSSLALYHLVLKGCHLNVNYSYTVECKNHRVSLELSRLHWWTRNWFLHLFQNIAGLVALVAVSPLIPGSLWVMRKLVFTGISANNTVPSVVSVTTSTTSLSFMKATPEMTSRGGIARKFLGSWRYNLHHLDISIGKDDVRCAHLQAWSQFGMYVQVHVLWLRSLALYA